MPKIFRLEKSEANKIIKEVAKAVSKWREAAKNFDITKKEIERMASAFEHEDLGQNFFTLSPCACCGV